MGKKNKNRNKNQQNTQQSSKPSYNRYRKPYQPKPPPQERRGRWLENKWQGKDCFRCSECGMRAINHVLITNPTGYKFCPNCGIRMTNESIAMKVKERNEQQTAYKGVDDES